MAVIGARLLLLEALAPQSGVQRTPVGLHDPLTQFHQSSWRALNSYVHAGIRPLARASGGIPVVLAEDLTRVSNGLVHIAFRLRASFLGQDYVDAVTRVWPAFRDALPPIVLPLTRFDVRNQESTALYPR